MSDPQFGTTGQVPALIASAAPLPLDDSKALKQVVTKREQWQEDTWTAYDEVPEIKFAVNFRANAIAKVVFYAAVEDLEGNVVPVLDEKSPIAGTPLATAADDEMSRFVAPFGGQAEINRLVSLNLDIPGECYLHHMREIDPRGEPGEDGYDPGRPEQWEVRSVSEVEITGQEDSLRRPIIKLKTSPSSDAKEIDNDNDEMARVWNRHPRFSKLADSHVRGLLGDIEGLTLLTLEQKAITKSRLSAGIAFVASELNFTIDGQRSTTTDPPDQAASPPHSRKTNPFLDAVNSAVSTPIEDPSSVAAVAPLFIAVPKDYVKEAMHVVSFARDQDSTLDEKISKKIDRIARGMNVPVEVVMGHMSTTFSNAEQIDQDTYEDFLEPTVMNMADAYLTGMLIPRLLDQGFEWEQVAQLRVAADTSKLISLGDPDKKADELLDAGAIGMTAYRRMRGVDESDAPLDDEQLLILAARKGSFGPRLTGLLLMKAGKLTPEEFELLVESTPAAEGGVDEEPTDDDTSPPEATARRNGHSGTVAAAARRKPSRNELGRKLAELDRDLGTRLFIATEAAMGRALERAGNKLKNANKDTRDTLRSVPPYRCAQYLGPRLVADLARIDQDELLAKAWDDLEIQFKAWSDSVGTDALDLISRQLSGLTSEERQALKLRQLSNIDEAWQWLGSSLGDEGKRILFAPEKGAAAIVEATGEVDLTARVQYGLIREALARAGGAVGIGGSEGIVEPANGRPLGGIATGADIMATLTAHGAGVEGYRWVYGPARRRTFEPHLALDGIEFIDFDDAALTNHSVWPATSYYFPGDHRGCVCDVEPIIITDQTAARSQTTTRATPVVDATPATILSRDDPRWSYYDGIENTDWRWQTDPNKRAAALWQWRYEDMNDIRTIQANVARGVDPFDGLGDMTPAQHYLRQELDMTTGQRVDVMTEAEYRNEQLAAALNLDRAIGNARPVDEDLFRGMRMDGADFVEGQTIELDGATSFTTDRQEARMYTEKRDIVGAGGNDVVMVRLEPGAKALSLKNRATGPMQGSSEHLTRGTFEVVSAKSEPGRVPGVNIWEVVIRAK